MTSNNDQYLFKITGISTNQEAVFVRASIHNNGNKDICFGGNSSPILLDYIIDDNIIAYDDNKNAINPDPHGIVISEIPTISHKVAVGESLNLYFLTESYRSNISNIKYIDLNYSVDICEAHKDVSQNVINADKDVLKPKASKRVKLNSDKVLFNKAIILAPDKALEPIFNKLD